MKLYPNLSSSIVLISITCRVVCEMVGFENKPYGIDQTDFSNIKNIPVNGPNLPHNDLKNIGKKESLRNNSPNSMPKKTFYDVHEHPLDSDDVSTQKTELDHTHDNPYNHSKDKSNHQYTRRSLKKRVHSHHAHHIDHKKRNIGLNSELNPSLIDHSSHSNTNNSSSELTLKLKRNQCKFPLDVGLVPVTLDKLNAGWAMSPDQECLPEKYCPYACPPGQVMAQWDPAATSYSYPISMNGGLYCDKEGNIQKPFPNKPYCVPGTGNSGVRNIANGVVSFCQTVLPGNEAMLIPTEIAPGSSAILAVPDISYWLSTAAHYYINTPGIPASQACIWGTKENPAGNWSPYVAGANTDASGKTFVKLGWNPVYLETTSSFRNDLPKFGVRLVCEGQCTGIPCAINPSTNLVNQVISNFAANGAGGAEFCVAVAESGSKIHIEVFEGNGSPDSSTVSSMSHSLSTSTSNTLYASSSGTLLPSSSTAFLETTSHFSLALSSSSSSSVVSTGSKVTSTSSSFSKAVASPSSSSQSSFFFVSGPSHFQTYSSLSGIRLTDTKSLTESTETSSEAPDSTALPSTTESNLDDSDEDNSGEENENKSDSFQSGIQIKIQRDRIISTTYLPVTSTKVVTSTAVGIVSKTLSITDTQTGGIETTTQSTIEDDQDDIETIDITSIHFVTKIIASETVTANRSTITKKKALKLSFAEDSEEIIVRKKGHNEIATTITIETSTAPRVEARSVAAENSNSSKTESATSVALSSPVSVTKSSDANNLKILIYTFIAPIGAILVFIFM